VGALACSSSQPESREQGLGVDDLAVAGHREELLQRRDPHLDGLVSVGTRLARSEVLGEHEMEPFLAEARRHIERCQLLETAGPISRLLGEFARGAVDRRFAGLGLSGGKFPQIGARGVTVLPHEHDVLRIGAREDREGTGVFDDIEPHVAPVVEAHDVAAHAEDPALERALRTDDARKSLHSGVHR